MVSDSPHRLSASAGRVAFNEYKTNRHHPYGKKVIIKRPTVDMAAQALWPDEICIGPRPPPTAPILNYPP